MPRISYVRTCADKVEAMHERTLVSVKVEPRPISSLSSALFYLASIYLPDKNLPARVNVRSQKRVSGINLDRNRAEITLLKLV